MAYYNYLSTPFGSGRVGVPAPAGLNPLDVVLYSCIALLCMKVVCGIWRWWRPTSTAAAQLIGELDGGDEAEGVVSTRYQRLLAYRFKAEFGELRYNKANRCIASDWVLKAMKEDDVRVCDRAWIMPIAVELCLLPTSASVMAAELARSHEVAARRAAADLCK